MFCILRGRRGIVIPGFFLVNCYGATTTIIRRITAFVLELYYEDCSRQLQFHLRPMRRRARCCAGGWFIPGSQPCIKFQPKLPSSQSRKLGRALGHFTFSLIWINGLIH